MPASIGSSVAGSVSVGFSVAESVSTVSLSTMLKLSSLEVSLICGAVVSLKVTFSEILCDVSDRLDVFLQETSNADVIRIALRKTMLSL